MVPSQRRPFFIVLSALLLFGSIAAFAGLYASAGHRQEVLIVTRTMEQGQPIVAGDLGQASAAISGGVDPIPASDAQLVSGRRAAVTIPAGSLLTMGDTTTSSSVARGDAVVGLALKQGQLPSLGLEAGDRVMVVQTGSAGAPLAAPASTDPAASTGPAVGSDSPDAAVLVPEASVVDVQTPSGQSSLAGSSATDSSLVSVEVSSTSAPSVSIAAAAGDVSLVLLPAGTGTRPSASGSGNTSSTGGGGNGATGGSGTGS